MLKRLYVDNVRCLQSFELRPGPVTALVGPNGGGKSTIFDVLASVQGFLGPASLAAASQFSPLSLTRWDSRLVQTVELEVEEPSGGAFVYRLEIHHDSERRNATVMELLSTAGGQLLYRLSNGQVELFGDDPSSAPRTTFPVDGRRSFLPILEPRPDNQKITAFKRWIAGMMLFRLRPDQIAPGTRSESDAIAHSGSNFVSWYRTLQQESPRTLERVREDMEPIVDGLKAIRLSRVGADEKMLTFDCSVAGREFALGLNELSEGQRVLLVLYTVMHAVADHATLLAFDEPDNFVAEREIQPWLASMRTRMVDAQRGTMLVLSHHPEVIDYLAADQILRLWRDGGSARQEALTVDREVGLPVSKMLKLGTGDA